MVNQLNLSPALFPVTHPGGIFSVFILPFAYMVQNYILGRNSANLPRAIRQLAEQIAADIFPCNWSVFIVIVGGTVPVLVWTLSLFVVQNAVYMQTPFVLSYLVAIFCWAYHVDQSVPDPVQRGISCLQKFPELHIIASQMAGIIATLCVWQGRSLDSSLVLFQWALPLEATFVVLYILHKFLCWLLSKVYRRWNPTAM